jgi:hypothetical protein
LVLCNGLSAVLVLSWDYFGLVPVYYFEVVG